MAKTMEEVLERFRTIEFQPAIAKRSASATYQFTG